MANILYRGSAVPSASNSAGVNNAPLTNDQIDKNFYALNTDKLDKVAATAQTVASAVTFSGNVTISGNLQVDGTTTTINTTTLNVDDINIELGAVANPSDATANGGGITLLGASNKTITWDSTNGNWTSNQDWNIVTGKSYKINNVAVLNVDTLGSGVTKSSLTKLGTGAGYVKSDASGNLTVDNSTFSLSSHGHYIGTTAVQATSAAQAVSGVSSLTNAAGSDLTITTSNNAGVTGALYLLTGTASAGNTDAGSLNITTGNGNGSGDGGIINITSGNGGTSANGNGGNINITSGNGTTAAGNIIIKSGNGVSSGGINIYAGNSTYAASGFAGDVSLTGGSSTGAGAQAGMVYVRGGANTHATAGVGGDVYIDGGSGPTTRGSVYIGSSASNSVSIGSSSNTTTVAGTVKLPNVGTSGFVKIGAGGQLSNDTNTYLTSVSTTNITDGAVTSVKLADGAATIAKGGTGITTYTAGDILYASAANTLSKLAKGSDGQVLKLASGLPTWGTDNDTDTVTRIRTGGNTFSAGDFTFSGSGSVSVTQTGGSISITGTDTTYSAGTGLTLTGTSFSVNYGTNSTTACVGNDSRLSDARTPTAHSHYIGTTSTQNSSGNQSISGINSISMANHTTLQTTNGVGQEIRRIYLNGDYYSGDYGAIIAGSDSTNVAGIRLGWDGSQGRIDFGKFWYSYASMSNAWPVSIRGLNGTAGYGIVEVSSGEVSAPVFKDYNDTAYFADLGNSAVSIKARGTLRLGLPSGNVAGGGGDGKIRMYGSNGGTGSIYAAVDVYTDFTPAYATYSGGLTGVYYASFDTNIGGYAFYKSGSSLMQIDDQGNVTATKNITAYSDVRLKTNIKTIENALDTTLKLRGVTFQKDGQDGIGVIAQEIKEVLPELVVEANDEQKTLSVAYGNIVGVLIEAIKELNAKVEDLQNQLANK